MCVALSSLDPTPAQATEARAGPAELAALTAQIVELRQQLRTSDAALAQADQEGAMVLAACALDLVTAYQGPPGERGSFAQWYPRMLAAPSGCDPLGPLPGWQQAWRQRCVTKQPLVEENEALHVSMHHLERLRDRLAQQLDRDARTDR